MISPVPSSIDLSTPLLGHHPMVTSLLNQSQVIIRPMKDGNGERKFKLGPIVTMSCRPLDSNAKNKTHQIPCNKTLLLLICLTSKLGGNSLQARVSPNGLRTYSANPPNTMSHLFQPQVKPQNPLTCEPEPEVAPTQSMEEPFACPATPTSIIIIDNMPV
ncbi:hypothetical protein O181_011374 [Austropuccinia psidii MF-1]|uniref:Uncharacterized protein n=1 Tax=Austropuccinia psidii MF-1 TaxID=1389203 RepID=A0A9Q3BSQ9_9BASI|nr:hypothetical protein [Austropuccinia psidii MF-1]